MLAETVFYSVLGLADLGSTEAALRRPGTYEANSLASHRSARIALKAAQVPALVWVDRRLGRRSKKLAWGWRAVAAAYTGWVVAHNLRQGRR